MTEKLQKNYMKMVKRDLVEISYRYFVGIFKLMGIEI